MLFDNTYMGSIWEEWKKKTYRYGESLQQKYGGSGLLDFTSSVARDKIPGMQNVHQSFQQSGEQGETPLGATSDFIRKAPGMNRVHGVAENIGKKGIVPSLQQAGGNVVQGIKNYGENLYEKYGDKFPQGYKGGPITTPQKFLKNVGKNVYENIPSGDFDKKWAKKQIGDKTPITTGEGRKSDGMDLSKYHGGDHKGQIHWWQTLAQKIGIDPAKAAASWKEKGGFEGLMANPAFTMGLAFMQAGAEGKSLGQGALDNVMKAGGISQHYKKIIEDRKQEPIQATAADIGEMKSMLDRFKIAEPNIWEKGFSWLKGENATADYDRAVEAIAIEYQKRVASAQKNNKSGKPLVIDSTFKERILRDMLNSKDFKEKKGWFGPFTKGTLEKKSVFRAEGGPIQAGKPYVVGEKGPEVIIPHSSGNVLSNDDSQIYAMLLAANPQLQKVSKTRAERILRSRFPEYFE